MSRSSSPFGSLTQAVKARAGSAAVPNAMEQGVIPPPARETPAGAGVHKPAAALGAITEGLRERVTRLEAEFARVSDRNVDLERELKHAKTIASRAGDSVDDFLFLDPKMIRDELPRDRLPGAFTGPDFEDLLEDIRANGQNDAITVRRSPSDGFEVAAGRRRLEVCRCLNQSVLARVRGLDDAAMLRVQFSENERREDISALERARWFAEVKSRLNIQAKDIAAQFGLDPSTLSLYLRLARFPMEIVERLYEPRHLSVLRARRIMEAIEADPRALRRILDALDAHMRASASRSGGTDPEEQTAVLMRVVESRGGDRSRAQTLLRERRNVVYRGRRVGTLTRNGGQWVFRFATSVGDDVVQALTDRIGELIAEIEEATKAASL